MSAAAYISLSVAKIDKCAEKPVEKPSQNLHQILFKCLLVIVKLACRPPMLCMQKMFAIYAELV